MRPLTNPRPHERESVSWSERNGDSRRMRRARITTRLVAGTFVLVLAALAGGSNSWAHEAKVSANGTFVAPGLLAKEQRDPNQKIRVIITSTGGISGAENAFNSVVNPSDGDKLDRRLGIVSGVAVELKAKKIERLAQIPGLIITEDQPAKASGGAFTSGQLWPAESGNSQLWNAVDANHASSIPTIAIVDSGIDASRADFAGRIVANVNLATATPNSPGDGFGHGTFVAGIAAGAATGYAGAAPAAPIAMIDVMNDNGMAWTSDVIAAAQWILQNKAAYNIRVANFSLHSDISVPFYYDPLDQAVEQLWFKGVTVVAAAGNYGNGTPVGVKYSPGDDPFVITVGAVDPGGTVRANDDSIAPWSAYGYTLDGFAKPEIAADGRYMVGPVPPGSVLVSQHPGQVTAPGYIQLSGTSFATPIVAGAAAHILALNPSYTPDQVKGALMLTARPVPDSPALSVGVGEVSAIKAATVSNAPNPNLALDQFIATNPLTGSQSFDSASWNSTVLSNASWNSASWNSASWNSASWNSASWNSASWNSASWNSASWNSASWNSAAAADDAAEVLTLSDASPDGAYPLTPTEDLAAQTDPDLQPLTPLDTTDPAAALP